MATGKKLKAVIFDMDGVILDSERVLMEIWEEQAKEIPMPGIRDVYISVCGTTRKTTGEMMRAAYGADFPFEELNKKVYTIRDERYKDGLPLKSGIRELLIYLKENGIMTALATSTTKKRASSQLEAVGLLDHFDVFVSGDMVERGKPDPEIFELAINKLGIEPADAVIIEDSFNGIRAARSSGAEVIMVPDLRQPDGEILGSCDHVFASLFEVLDHLRER